jgi:hypothetical protein
LNVVTVPVGALCAKVAPPFSNVMTGTFDGSLTVTNKSFSSFTSTTGLPTIATAARGGVKSAGLCAELVIAVNPMPNTAAAVRIRPKIFFTIFPVPVVKLDGFRFSLN